MHTQNSILSLQDILNEIDPEDFLIYADKHISVADFYLYDYPLTTFFMKKLNISQDQALIKCASIQKELQNYTAPLIKKPVIDEMVIDILNKAINEIKYTSINEARKISQLSIIAKEIEFLDYKLAQKVLFKQNVNRKDHFKSNLEKLLKIANEELVQTTNTQEINEDPQEINEDPIVFYYLKYDKESLMPKHRKINNLIRTIKATTGQIFIPYWYGTTSSLNGLHGFNAYFSVNDAAVLFPNARASQIGNGVVCSVTEISDEDIARFNLTKLQAPLNNVD